MNNISLIDLDQILASFLNRIEAKSLVWLLDPFTILFNHGFRVNELNLIPSWELLPDNKILCKTLKGSADRIITESEFPSSVRRSIEANHNYTLSVSVSALERAMFSNIPGGRFSVKSKNVSTHLFRHRKFKTLHASGLSITAIKSLMGLSNDKVVLGYIESIITQSSL